MRERLRHLLVTYDVETETKAGQRRLRKVADICCAHGVRVQKSVFECLLPPSEVDALTARLVKVMDSRRDTIRLYHLGVTMPRLEEFGKDGPMTTREPMIV